MKKNLLGTCVLIGGFTLLGLTIAAAFFGVPHTRAGALFVMILKALDVKDVFIAASVPCVAGTAVSIYALSRLLGDAQEDEPNKNADENRNDEN